MTPEELEWDDNIGPIDIKTLDPNRDPKKGFTYITQTFNNNNELFNTVTKPGTFFHFNISKIFNEEVHILGKHKTKPIYYLIVCGNGKVRGGIARFNIYRDNIGPNSEKELIALFTEYCNEKSIADIREIPLHVFQQGWMTV